MKKLSEVRDHRIAEDGSRMSAGAARYVESAPSGAMLDVIFDELGESPEGLRGYMLCLDHLMSVMGVTAADCDGSNPDDPIVKLLMSSFVIFAAIQRSPQHKAAIAALEGSPSWQQ